MKDIKMAGTIDEPPVEGIYDELDDERTVAIFPPSAKAPQAYRFVFVNNGMETAISLTPEAVEMMAILLYRMRLRLAP